jgi:hypothetical protein
MRSPSSSATDTSAPTDDLLRARAALIEQFEAHASSLAEPRPRLYAPVGVESWSAQYVRANIEPWDLADLALPGADAVRLDAAQTGLDNLALAGAWVRTPVNSTSVEAAVSSGLAAARALGAEARPIFAEHLFRRPSRHVWLPGRAPHSSNDAHASSHCEPDLERNPTIERGDRVAPPPARRAARGGRRWRAARTPP